jgi:hypothetical protein
MKKNEKIKITKSIESSYLENNVAANPNIQERLPLILALNKEIISFLESGSNGNTGGTEKAISIFHWVDCGQHSPHWCNTKCAGGVKHSSKIDPADRPECGGTPTRDIFV